MEVPNNEPAFIDLLRSMQGIEERGLSPNYSWAQLRADVDDFHKQAYDILNLKAADYGSNVSVEIFNQKTYYVKIDDLLPQLTTSGVSTLQIIKTCPVLRISPNSRIAPGTYLNLRHKRFRKRAWIAPYDIYMKSRSREAIEIKHHLTWINLKC